MRKIIKENKLLATAVALAVVAYIIRANEWEPPGISAYYSEDTNWKLRIDSEHENQVCYANLYSSSYPEREITICSAGRYKDQKTRMDHRIKYSTGTNTEFLITNGEWTYNWKSWLNPKTIYKTQNTPNPTDYRYEITYLLEDLNFRCEKWQLDEDMFKPPLEEKKWQERLNTSEDLHYETITP